MPDVSARLLSTFTVVSGLQNFFSLQFIKFRGKLGKEIIQTNRETQKSIVKLESVEGLYIYSIKPLKLQREETFKKTSTTKTLTSLKDFDNTKTLTSLKDFDNSH